MSKKEETKESDLVGTMEWALMTIRDKLQFGMPEEIAIQRREMRVKGVLIDSIDEVKKLESKLQLAIEALKDISDPEFVNCPREKSRKVLRQLEE